MRISDEKRREVARKLREDLPVARNIQEGYVAIMQTIGVRPCLLMVEGQSGDRFDRTAYEEGAARLAELIEPQPIDGNTSDGYHTFNELYHHRAVLFSVIVENFAARAWKSKLHADGTMYDGMFVVGIETPDGQATYHYDIDPYWDLFRCKEVDRAPEWDGHTPDQAIERIGKLVDCKTDRPTCKNSLMCSEVLAALEAEARSAGAGRRDGTECSR
ncbi:MAG: hypothetical protein SOV20_01065 [Coriobacteriales bacterium]|nr:hypothetical protein [Coriobacteriales bacterium]